MHRAIVVLSLLGLLAVAGPAGLSQEPPPPDLSPGDLAALEELRARPNWLFPARDCPADVMPAHEDDSEYIAGRCADDIAGCAARCRADDGGDCYNLAIALEDRETETQSEEALFEALYLRACRLGVVSGCTNRAAGITYRDPENADACAARTFRRTCARQDPWGCTMYGYHLMSGRGLPKDLDNADRMLRLACSLDEAFAACDRAKELLQEIADERAGQPATE